MGDRDRGATESEEGNEDRGAMEIGVGETTEMESLVAWWETLESMWLVLMFCCSAGLISEVDFLSLQ